jgi:hypothetical protein
MKTTLPNSSITRVTPVACSSAGRRSCEAGATIMNSVPRTSTARPPRPVVTTSPGVTADPRVATLLIPARAIVTGPEASLIDHPAGPARAGVEQVAAKTANKARRIAISLVGGTPPPIATGRFAHKASRSRASGW